MFIGHCDNVIFHQGLKLPSMNLNVQKIISSGDKKYLSIMY